MNAKALTRSALFALLAVASAMPALANDFPTVDRVIYVQDCIKQNPGNYYEMINKCSCALDRLAEQVKYEDYVTMSTLSNAVTIGGERGNELRDNETVRPQIKRLREMQAKAQSACFINPK